MNIIERIEKFLMFEMSDVDKQEYAALKAKRDTYRKSGQSVLADQHDKKLGELRARVIKREKIEG